jgi:hypothetical protein
VQFDHAISAKFSRRFIPKCDRLEYDALLVKAADSAGTSVLIYQIIWHHITDSPINVTAVVLPATSRALHLLTKTVKHANIRHLPVTL